MKIINGKLTEDNKVNLDKGYYFGYGVFETILTLNHPVMLREHLERLIKGLDVLGININISEDEVLKNIKLLKCYNEAVKISVSDDNIIYTKRSIPYTKERYIKGASLKVSSVRRNPLSRSVYIKSNNYIDNILENQQAKEEGYDDVIFLNIHGYVAECSVSNIFFIKKRQIYTPFVKCGLLEGIVRGWVLDNYSVVEGEYTLEDVLTSEGIFITNSLLGIMKVTKINNKLVNESMMIQSIEKKYRTLLKKY